MSLSATLFGRDSAIFKATNILGLGIPGWLDKKFGPPETEGPRLSDLSVQTSTFGAFIPRLYGTIAVHGNLLWLENNKLKERVRKNKTGGKGGGGSSEPTKTYTYSATFALGLCQGPIAGVRRIWCGDKLLYNAGSVDLETVIASNRNAKGWRLYLGTDDQLPDPRYEADVGVGNAPAFRGIAYLVFEDFQLADYSNTLQVAQFKVEVMAITELLPQELKRLSPAVEINQTNFNNSAASIRTYSGNNSGTNPTFDLTEHYPSSQVKRGPISRPINYRGNVPVTRVVGAFDFFVGNDGNSFVADGRFLNTSEFGVLWTDFQAIIGDDVSYLFARSFVGTSKVVILRRSPPLNEPGEVLVAISDAQSMCLGDDGYLYVLKENAIYRVDSYSGQVISSVSVAPSQPFGFSGSFCWFYEGKVWVSMVGATPVNYYLQSFSPSTGSQVDYVPMPGMGALPGLGVPFVIYGGVVYSVFLSGTTGVAYSYLPRPSKDTQGLSEIIPAECKLSSLINDLDIDASMLTAQVKGYRVSGGTIRAAIEPLQGAFPFDVIPSGYQIKCVPRGQSSLATIPWDDLGASEGDQAGDILQQSREMDTQLPARTNITYLDAAREYAESEQYAERINTPAINRVDRELPLVITADEAAGVAEVLQNLAWLERNDLAFSLPPAYLPLEASDVVTLSMPDAIYEVRLTDVNYAPGGRLECKAKPNRAALYTPNASGGEAPGPDGQVPLAGDSLFIPLDIPVVDETLQNSPGFIGAMTGYTDSWPGALAIRSADDGQTWADIQGYAGKASVATCLTALPASSCTLIDSRSLSISSISGSWSSITRDQMLSGQHYAAYGKDGRWEIVRYQSADLQPDGTYLLSGFIRGERGTEWATGLHQIGDWFIPLDDPDLAFIGAALEAISVPFTYRGVTSGSNYAEAADIPFTYLGVNLECLSPVYPKGSRDGSGNFTGSFTRRSRVTGTWWTTGAPTPVGETTEAYEVDVMSGSTVLRTISVTSPTFTYSAADQTTDFGSPQSSITFRIYQQSSVVGRGYPLEVTL